MMKSYEETAAAVLRRAAEIETRKRAQRRRAGRTLGVSALALALLGAGLWRSGALRPAREEPEAAAAYAAPPAETLTPTAPAASAPEITGPEETYAVQIPAVQLPESVPSDVQMDMIGLVVYRGGIYTQAEDYSGDEAAYEQFRALIGEKLGTAKGNIDCWSQQSDYATEFASTYTGTVCAVEGYDTDFRLCVTQSYQDETGEQRYWTVFLERLNGIGLSTGEDLFGRRLRLQGRITEIRVQSHADWDNARGNLREPEGVTEAQWDAFLDALYAAPFEDVHDADASFYREHPAQGHLILTLEDGTTVRLRLFEGGYVGYEPLGWYFVKMPEEAFGPVFDACR